MGCIVTFELRSPGIILVVYTHLRRLRCDGLIRYSLDRVNGQLCLFIIGAFWCVVTFVVTVSCLFFRYLGLKSSDGPRSVLFLLSNLPAQKLDFRCAWKAQRFCKPFDRKLVDLKDRFILVQIDGSKI